jgi:DNA polymerase-3 subunit delta'
MRDWPLAEIVQTLHKVCHDMQLLGQGAAPRFFAPQDLPAPPAFATLSQWGKDLANTSRTVEHPFNPGLMLEALASQAQSTLNSGPSNRRT